MYVSSIGDCIDTHTHTRTHAHTHTSVQLISQNQQEFIRMINEPVPAGQGGQQGAVGGQQLGAQGQGTPYTTIQVTAEEKEAIERVNPTK